MDCPKREAMNDSLIDPKMVLIATVNKSTKITGFSPRVFWAFPLGWIRWNALTVVQPNNWPKRSAQN